jgi:multiple sugar transport system ATP-binding protein
MAEVRLENVSKYYGRKLAVNNVSFTCKERGFLSIVGPTGAGKTTILKMIAGIEPVSSGNVYFNNHIVNELPPQDRNVSMAFESYNLYPHFTVYDNIAFPLRAPYRERLTHEEERKKVLEIADFLGIRELLDRKPQYLSGGQKQRVGLARALVRKPEVYLLDEPIAHLDARLKFSTQTLLKEFAAEYKSTIIYVTHDYREALALSDKMVVLRKGVIEQAGTPGEVYYTPATDFVGRLIGEPPINLIDGEIVIRDKEAFFRAGDNFAIPIRQDLVDSMNRVARQEEDKRITRLGIRCDDIKVSRQKISENSFQLPVYAIVREAESDIVTFELKDTFLYARVKEEKGYCDYCLSEKVWLDFDQSHMFFFKKTLDISKG